MEALDGCVFDRSVHPRDLAVCRENSPLDCFLILQTPGVVGLGQAVLDPVGFADHVETHWPGANGVAVPGLLSELNAPRHCLSDQWRSKGSIREKGVDLVGHSLEHRRENLPSGAPVSLVCELRHGELAGAVDADKEIQLAFSGLHFGDVDMKEPDGVAIELLTLWFVAFDIGQARYAFAIGLEPMAPQWLIAGGTGAATTASDVGSTVAPHGGSRPEAAVNGVGTPRSPLPPPRSEPLSAAPSVLSSGLQSLPASATPERSSG